MSKKSAPTRIAILAPAIALGGLLIAGIWRSGQSSIPPQPLSMAGTPVANSAFIGSKACRQCHPGEYAAFQGSGHSRTLARAGETEVAGKIDGHVYDDPENPGVKWRYTRDGKQLIAERQEGEKHLRAILDYALGSGNHAMTFVSLSKDGKIPPSGEEHRMSYFAHSDTVSLTPGHIRKMNEPGKTPTGLHLPPAGVLDCIECHGTQTVPPIKKGLTPETMIPNVSCERCHGPGRAHVEAATRLAASGGDGSDLPSLAMPFNGEEDGTKQVAMCGHCHRLPSMIPTDWIRTDNATLARFPSVGLSFSACYTKSAGTLSCTTCHEPHGRTSTDTAAYEAICLSCHTAQEEKGKPASLEPTASTTNKPCPVNPRNGCVECHMPLRKPSEAGLRFTDHWIRKPDPPAGQ